MLPDRLVSVWVSQLQHLYDLPRIDRLYVADDSGLAVHGFGGLIVIAQQREALLRDAEHLVRQLDIEGGYTGGGPLRLPSAEWKLGHVCGLFELGRRLSELGLVFA